MLAEKRLVDFRGMLEARRIGVVTIVDSGEDDGDDEADDSEL